MLVDEVRPEKSGRAVFRYPVPGHGDDQKDQGAGENPQFAPPSPAAGEQDKEKHDAEREEHADQTQRKSSQSHDDRGAPISHACVQAALPAAQEKVEERGQLQRKDRLRDHHAGKQPWSHAGAYDQPGVKRRRLAEKTPGKKIDHQHQSGHRKHQRQPGLESALTEKLVAHRHHPVMQRRLFEIADPVLIHHHPVAALQHLAGDQRMRGVGVVEQRRLSGGSDVNSERHHEQGEDGESAIH